MEGGGAERVAALLCNHWASEGHHVTLMPTFSGRGGCSYPLETRVHVEYLADRVGSVSRSMINKVRRWVALRRAMRDIGPDVVVSFLPHVNVAAVLCGRGLPLRVVVSERTYPPAMPLRWEWEVLRKFTYSRAAGVVVQTEKALAWLACRCPGARGRVIPNPVVFPLPTGDPVVSPTSVIPGARRVVLAAGRLGEEKGFDALIAAFHMLANQYPEWDLVILGEGPEREGLVQLRDRMRLGDRVYLPGRVGNPGDWYARADFYVLSSRFEGFPNTLVEAMAHGLPAVSFDCETGPADIIREGIDGYLVQPNEGAEGLVQGMSAMMADDDMRERMGAVAVSVRERFSPERVMAEWDGVLGLNNANHDV